MEDKKQQIINFLDKLKSLTKKLEELNRLFENEKDNLTKQQLERLNNEYKVITQELESTNKKVKILSEQ